MVGALALDQGDGARQRGAVARTDGAAQACEIGGRLNSGHFKHLNQAAFAVIRGVGQFCPYFQSKQPFAVS